MENAVKWCIRAVWLCIGMHTGVVCGKIITLQRLQVDGLVRVEAGTVYNALPVKVGDTLDTEATQPLIRALFDTGLFERVSIFELPNGLRIQVEERAGVASVRFQGNVALTHSELQKAVSQVGLQPGFVADPALIKRAENALEKEYFAQGRYAVRVQTRLEKQVTGSVDVVFSIQEGPVAKIRGIRIWGARQFSHKQLLSDWELGLPNMWSWFTKRDRYAQDKLSGDLERLRSFYFDKGYIQFVIRSVRVSVSPDKAHVFIDVAVNEGAIYHLTQWDIQVEGKADAVSLPALRAAVSLPQNAIFSRFNVFQAIERVQTQLGKAGYTMAHVEPVWSLNETDKTVAVTIKIQPNRPMFVRRIDFKGNAITQDSVLRRAVLQYEGSLANASLWEQSKTRLLRTGFFSDVQVQATEVPGASDSLDLLYTVKEHPSGTLTGGVAYSPDEAGIRFDFSMSQKNFLGTGNSVDVGANYSEASTAYQFAFTDPYFTASGISQSWFVNYSETRPARVNLSAYTTDRRGLGVQYGIPITGEDSVQMGVSYKKMRIKLPRQYEAANDPQGLVLAKEVTGFLGRYGHAYDLYPVSLGWQHSALDRAIFPTRGLIAGLTGVSTLPGSSLGYYTIQAQARAFYPLKNAWVAMLRGQWGYGNVHRSGNTFPFFEHFLSGGEQSVRGFELNSLGPRGTDKEPLGGNVQLEGTAQLFFPNGILDAETWRTAVFLDAGNVYKNRIQWSHLRASVGLAVEWMSPLGSVAFGVAEPVRYFQGDRRQRVFFTMGTSW